jgi:FtsH-binding integral membrane protein
MFVNMLLGSESLGFLISIGGVIIFTGLTAYDTQKIMHMSQNPQIQADGNLTVKFSIIGALTLYLDFINLFLFLLRIFAGGKRN